jgi:hypothetical protein
VQYSAARTSRFVRVQLIVAGDIAAATQPSSEFAVMPEKITPNTFNSIELEPQTADAGTFPEFVQTLLQKLHRLKEERFAYYEELRQKNTRWANGARALLAGLGAVAFLLTAVAAAARFVPPEQLPAHLNGADKIILVLVLAIYAVMGTVSFYEKATDKTASYFRYLGVILAIRDLWTKFQFEVLKEVMTFKSASNPTTAEAGARERVRALAEAFCTDLNKASTAELAEWKTEFLTSLSDLEAAAKKGSEDVTKQIQDNAKTAEKAAADAKASADKAAAEAKTAAKAAEEAVRSGTINVSVSGEFDDEVVVSVDGTESARGRGKMLALERVPPGAHKISAHAKKGVKELETSQWAEVKPGVQELKLTLS